MAVNTSATAAGLGDFIDASPSPFHVCATVAAELDAAGYVRVFEDRPWSTTVRGYVIRGGSIIAWDHVAKATPDGEQNEADYLKAFYFVEETKLVVEEEEPEQPDPMQNQNA